MKTVDQNTQQPPANTPIGVQTNAPKVPIPKPKRTTIATTERRNRHKLYDLNLVERLAAAGLSHTQMAYSLDVSDRTLNALKKREDFRCAVEKGKSEAIKHVEQSLYLRCIGFKEESEGKLKYYAPSDLAIMFFLNNRAPDRWKHATHMSQDVTQLVNISDFSKLSTEEKKKIVQQMKDLKDGKKLELAPEQKQ